MTQDMIKCVPDPASPGGTCLVDVVGDYPCTLRVHFVPDTIEPIDVPLNPPPWSSFVVPANAAGILIEDLSGQSQDHAVAVQGG